MVYCTNCKSIDIKILDLNFASIKREGEPAAKAGPPKKQFICLTCHSAWISDPEADNLYFEYIRLKNETTLVAQILPKGGVYKAQHIDPDRLIKRHEVAKKILASYTHVLDIGPWEWHELEQDAE